MSLPYKRNEPYVNRIMNGTAGGIIGGGIFGAVKSNWGDVPNIYRDKAWPALVRTGTVMANNAGLFGAVGLVYTTTEVAAEVVRGKADFWNGAIAGLASGSIVGFRYQSMGMGVAAGGAFAVMSMLLDATNGQLIGPDIKDRPKKPSALL